MLSPLSIVGSNLPEPSERPGQREVGLGVGLTREGESRTQVVVVALERIAPFLLLEEALGVGAFGQGEKRGEVPAPDNIGVRSLCQTFLSVLTYRLEQMVTGLGSLT